ncbi:hypothetical protein R3P38DRAFT_2803347 [Favolaschia claudopus]|uniref:Uncharacterized protein n=1 Tax=Favolaschia claudopus TaxID=2862362 RepID=A0AAV9ZTZ3_9AGAR
MATVTLTPGLVALPKVGHGVTVLWLVASVQVSTVLVPLPSIPTATSYVTPVEYCRIAARPGRKGVLRVMAKKEVSVESLIAACLLGPEAVGTRDWGPKADRQCEKVDKEGARETILTPHLDAYQAAKDQGRRQERKILKRICREFHARVGWRVRDHEEPVLKEWDPTAPEEEEMLSPEEEAEKAARILELDARIRRWFTYRLRKIRKSLRSNRDIDPRKDPYAVLLANLSGVTAPPKALQAYQQFMRESYDDKIAPVVAERWEEEKKDKIRLAERSKEPKAGFRAEVARQKTIGGRAKEQAAEAKEAYVRSLKNSPSQAPEARQKCIDSVADFVGPILQGLHAHTGMHATLIMGGPVPMYGGELRTLHVSYGRNRTVLGLLLEILNASFLRAARNNPRELANASIDSCTAAAFHLALLWAAIEKNEDSGTKWYLCKRSVVRRT